MKAGKAHVVPLSDRAVELLRTMPRTGEHVFINGGGKPLSNMAMAELIKGMGVSCTVHGFRSTFMDWAHERTGYDKHVIDMALAHAIGDKTEAVYRRGRSARQAHQADERVGALLRRQGRGRWRQHCGHPRMRVLQGPPEAV